MRRAMGDLTRQPTSNDSPQPTTGKSRWLEDDDMMDECALLLNGLAQRCTKCQRATHNRHLDANQRCPDCR